VRRVGYRFDGGGIARVSAALVAWSEWIMPVS
jgi:hypothetical protein